MAWRIFTVPWPFGFQSKLVAAARQAEMSGTKDGLIRSHDTVLERRQGEERLDRRARRVCAAQGAIDQRLVDVVLQGVVLFGRQAASEGVGVEARGTGEGDHIAAVRIDGDGRAAFAR